MPLIVSYTADDAALRMTNFKIDAAGVKEELAKQHGAAKAERIFNAYRAEYPDISDYLINARIATDTRNARSVIKQLELKAAQPDGAPCYQYIWEWKSQGMDGKFGAVHGVDVQFAFHNARGPLEGGARHGSAPDGRSLRVRLGRVREDRQPEQSRAARVAGVGAGSASRHDLRRQHARGRASACRLQEMWREVEKPVTDSPSR